MNHRLLPGERGEDEPVHRLHTPSVGQEFSGQPIEKSGMGGRVRKEAEIVGGSHDGLTKMMLPKPID